MEVNLIVIRTEYIDKLAKFYEKLGFVFEYHQHGNGPMHYSSQIGKVIFEIYPLRKSDKKSYNGLRLGFEVENLDELIDNIKAEGHLISQEPKKTEWGYIAVIKDIDGRKIELKEKRKISI